VSVEAVDRADVRVPSAAGRAVDGSVGGDEQAASRKVAIFEGAEVVNRREASRRVDLEERASVSEASPLRRSHEVTVGDLDQRTGTVAFVTQKVVERLDARDRIEVKQVSPAIRSAPVGAPIEQPARTGNQGGADRPSLGSREIPQALEGSG